MNNTSSKDLEIQSKFKLRVLAFPNAEENDDILEKAKLQNASLIQIGNDDYSVLDTQKDEESESSDSEEIFKEEMEPLVEIPKSSTWGQFGIKGIYTSHQQCPSLLRSEGDFLALNINEKIQKKIEYSKESREKKSGNYIQNVKEIKDQQHSILNLSKIVDVKQDEINFEAQLQIEEYFNSNEKDRNYLIHEMQDDMKAHEMEDFLHLGALVFQNKISLDHLDSEEDEFFDAEEYLTTE